MDSFMSHTICTVYTGTVTLWDANSMCNIYTSGDDRMRQLIQHLVGNESLFLNPQP